MKRKIGLSWEKKISDFAHFPSHHLHLMQTSLWRKTVVDNCKTINIFPHHPSWCNRWNQSLESERLHKAENTDNIFDYQYFHRKIRSPSGAGGSQNSSFISYISNRIIGWFANIQKMYTINQNFLKKMDIANRNYNFYCCKSKKVVSIL